MAAFGAVMAGAGVSAQTPIPPSSLDFAMSAAQSDQYEIEAARVALAQSRDPRIRRFAQRMIDDHTQSRDGLRQAATASGLPPPPPSMTSDQSALLAALQSLRGADFDKTYIRQQILGHSQALAVEQSYAATGQDMNLRRAARSAVPMIQSHLAMAREIGEALGAS
jgi:putative membrane protein